MGMQKMEVGTMKANSPMETLMASLNIMGRDKFQEMPGRGLVGEILYPIPERSDWEDMDINMQGEFGGRVSS